MAKLISWLLSLLKKDIPVNITIAWSITKLLIIIGSLHAYLSCNQHAITWLSNYRCPIWTFCNWIPAWFTRHPRFHSFFHKVLHSFQQFWKVLQTFSLKRTSQKTFLIPKFVISSCLEKLITKKERQMKLTRFVFSRRFEVIVTPLSSDNYLQVLEFK